MLKIDVDERQFRRLAAKWPSQARFATSLGINNTLLAAQRAQQKHDAQAFDIRNRTFMNRAVKIRPFARKTTLSGTIRIEPPGGRADILTKFEKGGLKRPRGKSLAVPARAVRRTGRGVVKTQKPRAVIERGGFIGRTRRGTRAVFARVGSGKRTRVRFMYALVPRARIRPRLRFHETVLGAINQHGHSELLRAWQYALRTAR